MMKCRICLDDDNTKNLISPCRCKGSMGAVHSNCIEQWIRCGNRKQCELCHTLFHIRFIYPPIHTITCRLFKALWHDKWKLLRIVLVTACGYFLYKKIRNIHADILFINANAGKSWIKRFSLQSFFGVYYAQILMLFVKETKTAVTDIIKIIKKTSQMSIANYQ